MNPSHFIWRQSSKTAFPTYRSSVENSPQPCIWGMKIIGCRSRHLQNPLRYSSSNSQHACTNIWNITLVATRWYPSCWKLGASPDAINLADNDWCLPIQLKRVWCTYLLFIRSRELRHICLLGWFP
jgi:hypothetical protein